jgi:hypothetical protein
MLRPKPSPSGTKLHKLVNALERLRSDFRPDKTLKEPMRWRLELWLETLISRPVRSPSDTLQVKPGKESMLWPLGITLASLDNRLEVSS